MTGTPIQNKLSDFASIVKFLQVYPYCIDTVFQEDISGTWQRGDPKGFLRLKILVRSITISRTKAVVYLPPRIDEVHHLDFSPEERHEYEFAKDQMVSMLEEAISTGGQQRNRFNALSRLNILRLICSHGLLARKSQTTQIYTVGPGSAMELDYSDIRKPLSDMSLGVIMSCSNCGIDMSDDLWNNFTDDVIDSVQRPYSFCWGCSCDTKVAISGHMGFDLSAPTLKPNLGISPSSSSPSTTYENVSDFESMSTKVKALVADLKRHCDNEKRSAHWNI